MPEFKDGLYQINEVKNSLEDSFQTEKELCNFIESNIVEFTSDCIGLQYESHKREYSLYTTRKRSIKGNRRIDFLIITKCGKRIGIECKKPKYTSELASAIGQCLSYLALFDGTDLPLDKIILLSSKIDFVIPLILNKFSLPIEYICIDKKKFLTLLKNDK